jgi:Holliday junction resolvase RusA-like endonuclease
MQPSGLETIRVSFFIPGLPPSPNQTKGLHWAKLEATKKEWMGVVKVAAYAVKQRENLRGLYDHATIHFHISLGDNRRRDADNLIWSVCKPTLDALTGVLITDDNIDAIQLGFSFDREKPKGYLVTIDGR